MDYSSQSVYLNAGRTAVTSHFGTVPGMIPINNEQEKGYTSEAPATHHLGNHTIHMHDTVSNDMAETEETNTHVASNLSKAEMNASNENITVKTEAEEDEAFVTENHDTLNRIHLQELTIKQAADILGRPYSYTYRRYQEFVIKITGIQPPKRRGGDMARKDGKKKRRAKKLTMVKAKPLRVRQLKSKLTGDTEQKLTGEVHKCEECPAIFDRVSQLKSHIKVHNIENESHPCTACGEVFPSLNKLMNHRITSHDDALQCPYCQVQYTNVPAYNYHLKTHTRGEKNYICKECGKAFHMKGNLKKHLMTHTGEKNYMCGYCGKAFIELSKLKQHHFTHTGGGPYACEECGKRFTANASLMEHMNTHKDVKPYACDECDARFNFKTGLKLHKMSHTGEQPFKCQFCPAAYKRSIDLQRHSAVHTGLKEFKCDQCEYTCTRKATLEYHQNSHTGTTPYKCDFPGCDMAYGRPSSLQKHKLKHGPGPTVPCKLCNEQFANPYELKGHMMLHTGEKPFICDQCPKVCYDEAALKRHKYKHIYKPFETKQKQIRPKKIYKEPKVNTGFSRTVSESSKATLSHLTNFWG